MAIPVVTKASGLVYIEPKLPVQTKYHVQTENGIHDVWPDVRFELFLANFSKNPQQLPKGMKIANAKRNPLAILTVPDEVSTKLKAILNLPFTTTTANGSTNKESVGTNGPDELTKPTDWRNTIDLGHIENDEMQTKILTMLTKHEDMWKTGRLGEITATEHRVDFRDRNEAHSIDALSSRPGDANESGSGNKKDAGRRRNRTCYLGVGLTHPLVNTMEVYGGS